MTELATARVARKPLAARFPVAGRRRARAAAAGRCLLAPRTARSRPPLDFGGCWAFPPIVRLVGVLIPRELVLVCLFVRRSLLSLGPGAEGRSHYLGSGSPLRLPPRAELRAADEEKTQVLRRAQRI
eukprot:scaffold22_cov107-Isochrysis_galbana.AAC.1